MRNEGRIGRLLIGAATVSSIALGFGGDTGATVTSNVTTNYNVCRGPVIVTETLTSTGSNIGTARFVTSTGEVRLFNIDAHAVSPYETSGYSMIVVDNSPFLQGPNRLLHIIDGSVYYSEGGYITGFSGTLVNICKRLGDWGGTRLSQ